MPPKIINNASEAELRRANVALKNIINGNMEPNDGEDLNNIPKPKILKFSESIDYFASAKTSWQVLEAGLDRFIPLIQKHKELVSQNFDIKISVIMSEWKTLKHKLALANAIFRKTFTHY